MNIDAAPVQTSQPRLLLCPPRHFAVTYSINPWMDPQRWADGAAALHQDAQRQWAGLRRALVAAGAMVETLAATPELPDLVFTANAAVVLDGRALLARFRHRERQREQPVFAAAFRALQRRGLISELAELPLGIRLEGAGDCIWDMCRQMFWLGCGFRSDADAGRALCDVFGVPSVPLALADPSFYHLDTAFCALPSGDVMYYPEAFTPAALGRIHERVSPDQRIALDRADAERFAANAVCLDRTIVLSSCSDGLRGRLRERGYAVVETPLDVFQRSGGSACCLTLRLDHASAGAVRQRSRRRAGAH